MSTATDAPIDPFPTLKPFTPSKRSANGRNGTSNDRMKRNARLAEVGVADMAVSPLAQRDLRNARVNKIAQNFDPDRFGTITVSWRDGRFFVVDGQHRVEALRTMGWEDQKVPAWVYENLTEQDEAALFLDLNDQLTVAALDKFRVAVTAGESEASAISRLLAGLDLRINGSGAPGTITAVGTVKRIYTKYGPEVLSRALAIVTMAFGDAGLTAAVIEGMSLVAARYGDSLRDDRTIARLQKMRAGVVGLMNAARQQQQVIGRPLGQCVAAEIVNQLNTGRGGHNLPKWWE